MDPEHRNVLVTGATGYIGGRLVPHLLEKGHSVRCLARSPQKLDGMPWRDQVEVVKGDLNDAKSLVPAMKGMDAAHYLVHSMGDSDDFAKRDREVATTFREAAATAKLKRIVYLGGLGDHDDPLLSKHLRSRHQVGEVLAEGSVPVTELRAAVIIGSGSASFEMLRNITDVLPVMITPRWVRTRCQPIAIRDVLFYLSEVLDKPETTGQVLEIGGPDILTYQQMMTTYAEKAGLRKRRFIAIPFLTPKLSSHWVGLVTPLPTSIAKELVGGLANEVILHDDQANKLMPHQCASYSESIDRAIKHTLDFDITTSWAGADISGRSPADPMPTDPSWSGGTVLEDVREVETDASPHDVYKIVTGIGGKRGWFVTDKLWAARGVIDKLVGGVGMRRGRRNPDELRVGDPLDFWRVEALVPDKQVRLRAEMRLPGVAWLEWTISEQDGKTKLRQYARFQPRGVPGRLYWYSLSPFHGIIFKGLAKALTNKAEQLEAA